MKTIEVTNSMLKQNQQTNQRIGFVWGLGVGIIIMAIPLYIIL